MTRISRDHLAATVAACVLAPTATMPDAWNPIGIFETVPLTALQPF